MAFVSSTTTSVPVATFTAPAEAPEPSSAEAEQVLGGAGDRGADVLPSAIADDGSVHTSTCAVSQSPHFPVSAAEPPQRPKRARTQVASYDETARRKQPKRRPTTTLYVARGDGRRNLKRQIEMGERCVARVAAGYDYLDGQYNKRRRTARTAHGSWDDGG